MRQLAILLALVALPTFARAQTDCATRDPRLTPTVHVGGDVHLRMSLDEAEQVLAKRGYARIGPADGDAGRTFQRRKDGRLQVTTIASFASGACVDYVATTSRAAGKIAPPDDDVAARLGPIEAPGLHLSRFRALGKSIIGGPQQGGGCELSMHSVVWNQQSFELINVCALLGAERLAPEPLPQADPMERLREKAKRPTFELLPDR